MTPSPQITVAITEAEARDFVRRWFPAWLGGASSAPTLVAFYAPNAFYRDPNVPQGIRGTEALTNFFVQLLANHPQWKFEIVALYPTAKGFILNWTAWIPLSDGRELNDFRGVDILELADGRIVSHENYFDLSVFLKA